MGGTMAEEMTAVDEIRAGLKQAARDKLRARELETRATEDMRELLRLVRQTRKITMREAAELAGIKEARAYELIRQPSP